MSDTALLVVAKAPEPGLAKTRLSPPASADEAAGIAAASLLDTLRAVRAVPDSAGVVAWTGELACALRREEIAAALNGLSVVPQRGDDFGARLAAAHADVAEVLPHRPVVQIGMDTPQVTGNCSPSAPSRCTTPRDRMPSWDRLPTEAGGHWDCAIPAGPRCWRKCPCPVRTPGT